MLSRTQTRWTLVVGMGMCVALIGACGQEPAPTTPATELTLEQDTPEHAVASALRCVRHVLDAATAGDKPLARAYRNTLRGVASELEIEKAIARSPRVAIMLGNDPIDGYLDNWCSALSYYANDIDERQLTRVSETPTRVVLRGAASEARNRQPIEFVCVTGADSRWHLAHIEFVAAASQPAPTPVQSTP